MGGQSKDHNDFCISKTTTWCWKAQKPLLPFSAIFISHIVKKQEEWNLIVHTTPIVFVSKILTGNIYYVLTWPLAVNIFNYNEVTYKGLKKDIWGLGVGGTKPPFPPFLRSIGSWTKRDKIIISTWRKTRCLLTIWNMDNEGGVLYQKPHCYEE